MKYKRLFSKLADNLRQIEGTGDRGVLLSAILHRLVDDFHDDLGLIGGRIYLREEDDFVLQEQYPAGEIPAGFRVPASYGPIQQLMRQGFVIHEVEDPEVDRGLEQSLGVEAFATILLDGPRPRLIAFSLKEGSNREHVVYTLNTVRHVINLQLRKQHLEDRVAEAREIQLSMLPSRAPRFADYDVWGSSIPAEEVGGDLYDYIEVSERSLGIAVADSAGHGLPAALQARDSIVGLRMSVEERLRITATMEKLNKVIGRSALASRFISFFYGEIEANGTFVYCNAGHPPGLLLRDGEFSELRDGGLVLGPNPEARYERGYTMLRPGSALVIYTDGITEAENASHEMFGTERLREVMRSRRWNTARELVEEVFARVQDFSDVETPVDDQTVVAVLRKRD